MQSYSDVTCNAQLRHAPVVEPPDWPDRRALRTSDIAHGRHGSVAPGAMSPDGNSVMRRENSHSSPLRSDAQSRRLPCRPEVKQVYHVMPARPRYRNPDETNEE